MNITRQVLITVILAIVFFELSDEKNRNKRRNRRFRNRRKIGGRPSSNKRTIGGRSRQSISTFHGRSAPRRAGRSSRRSGANTRRRIRGRGRNLIRGRGLGSRPGQNRLTYAPMKHAVTEPAIPNPRDDVFGFDDKFRLPKQFCPCATGEPEYNEEWEKSHSRWSTLIWQMTNKFNSSRLKI